MSMLFKQHYYYLVAGLPDLLLDEGRQKGSLAFFKSEFENNLDSEDYELVKLLFLKYDNDNLINLLFKKYRDFIQEANYSRDLLEEEIKQPDNRIVSYLSRFIEKFKADEHATEGVSWETELENDFYDFILTSENDFLRDWFTFDMNLRNVATGLTCRDHDMEPDAEIIGDNAIAHQIKRSNAGDFGLAQEFPEVDKIVSIWQTSHTLTEREKALDQLRWDWLEDHVFFHYFTIERLLAFLLRLEMVERWMQLDEESGKAMFDKLLESLGKEFTLPEEFSLQNVKRK
jgi:hypothetical protein